MTKLHIPTCFEANIQRTVENDPQMCYIAQKIVDTINEKVKINEPATGICCELLVDSEITRHEEITIEQLFRNYGWRLEIKKTKTSQTLLKNPQQYLYNIYIYHNLFPKP